MIDVENRLREELAELVPRYGGPDWSEVLVIAAQLPSHGGRSEWFGLSRGRRVAIGAAVLALLLGGVAAATYVVAHTAGTPSAPSRRNGPLTLNANGAIVALAAHGRLAPIWRCPRENGCGILNGVAWSGDGRWLAYIVPRWGRTNAAAGLHVVDTSSRHEWHLPPEKVGCRIPYDPAWSPDGLQLAYACPSRIFVIGRNLSQRRSLTTGIEVGRLSSPAWSADGNRIAYSLHLGPMIGGSNAVYTVARTGAHRRLIAAAATAPAWSPDGRLVAVRAACGGIKLLTPAGRDVTPWRRTFGCRAIGVPGVPDWSPDGRKLAIQMRPRGGVYVVDRDGSHLTVLIPRGTAGDTGGGAFGGDRPAWRPSRPHAAPAPARAPDL